MKEKYLIKRRKTKKVYVGGIGIGGDFPVTVQSMTNTKTHDVRSTVNQILALEEAGCDLVRVAVPDMAAAEAIAEIKKNIHIPLVADIHFDYRLALEAIKNGADKVRINPGNIGGIDRIKKVVEAARERCTPIRIGVNSGSLERDILDKYGAPCAEALVESALRNVSILESLDFGDIVISIKSSDVLTTVKAYELLAQKVDYPFHLGVTEAGTKFSGTVKSSVGLGILLYEGIGDTIRVSLTGDPVDEVRVGKDILKSLNLIESGVNLISCPTCGRCEIDLIGIAREVEDKLKDIKKPIKVAVMGCIVNGPGEAKEADIGIAGGTGRVAVFKRGRILKTVPASEAVEVLISEIRQMLEEDK
ncbi:flavodoxin-dependent (E)-4-hydroxy-3-methylbut-2-enyl-diphosphate synthase [Thermosediminibacter oceani]|uniref:4-hydroxy-3-methylbut-2-en-1-yl diphosphate synthase (flavodoxin) n=1 Tax=Thermosediminibacter oceani (strain ATCC BAA-1034 / DSM 16646 / JW/IW-1228P) TaxID=555079 RepID=D9S3M8_THEOJ|nr:flavodoxin-dependent (E)-4-hydroxy-3-methylbut-2-enyl-diphosphate synthase [Thermosediminibacter oceani]ADL08005.1 4-hydroxy-3-methylbut-2-en-1-yl diphosphate synthase [Thermosediminibacter oceani DSM 16646]